MDAEANQEPTGGLTIECSAMVPGVEIMKTLAELFEHTLQDVFYAENAIVKALPKVAKAVSDVKLKTAVELHLDETKGHVATLKKVFASLSAKPQGEKCDAIEGLLKEADGLLDEASGTALDAGLLAAAQAVEHYEIFKIWVVAGVGESVGP